MAFQFILTISRPSSTVPFWYDTPAALGDGRGQALFAKYGVTIETETSPDSLVQTRKITASSEEVFDTMVGEYNIMYPTRLLSRENYCKEHGHDLRGTIIRGTDVTTVDLLEE